MKNRIPLFLAALAIVGMAACGDDPAAPIVKSNQVTFTATMTVANEVPTPTVGNPTGSGTFTATLDTVTNVFTYDLTFTGLSSGVNNGHIHAPADVGVATAAILNFNTLSGATFSFGATSGTGHGTALLTNATVFVAANTATGAPAFTGDS